MDRRLEEVARIKQSDVPEGVDMSSWALAWCLRHPAVTTIIPGCKSVGQVEKNAAVAALVADQKSTRKRSLANLGRALLHSELKRRYR